MAGKLKNKKIGGGGGQFDTHFLTASDLGESSLKKKLKKKLKKEIFESFFWKKDL